MSRGEYALYLRSQDGLTAARKFDLGNPPSFFYGPTWSPDSKKIAYADKRQKLWYVSRRGTPVSVDADTIPVWGTSMEEAWFDS